MRTRGSEGTGAVSTVSVAGRTKAMRNSPSAVSVWTTGAVIATRSDPATSWTTGAVMATERADSFCPEM